MTRFQFSLWASEVMWEGFIEQVRLAVRGEPLERQELKRMTQWQMMCESGYREWNRKRLAIGSGFPLFMRV